MLAVVRDWTPGGLITVERLGRGQHEDVEVSLISPCWVWNPVQNLLRKTFIMKQTDETKQIEETDEREPSTLGPLWIDPSKLQPGWQEALERCRVTLDALKQEQEGLERLRAIEVEVVGLINEAMQSLAKIDLEMAEMGIRRIADVPSPPPVVIYMSQLAADLYRLMSQSTKGTTWSSRALTEVSGASYTDTLSALRELRKYPDFGKFYSWTSNGGAIGWVYERL